MKKTLRQVLVAGLLVSAGWASAAVSVPSLSTTDFSTASGTSFLNSFLITPTLDNTLFVSIYGADTQYSSLSFQIAGGPMVSATNRGGNLIASFNDGANNTLGNAYTLLAGESYVLTVTGVTKALTSGVNGSLSITVRSGGVSILPDQSLPAITPVPEPETWAMLLAGLGFVGFVARRRARKV
ncbi:FxDxF family PEP-CTERM protein [Rhodoferax sp. U11-2br]|uniref:FxDxF family PEP-CTERM protein n=1 Tax=Rhodoferax sp. U11-2br TaxID=2838878 RepID=UPI0020367B75|nr:FxDxF family PEP-CTERM protein [Rhodoferax sp. U11-2br]